jgi:hypothetical protein
MLQSTVYMDLYSSPSGWLLFHAGSSVTVLTLSVGCRLLFYKIRSFAGDAVLMWILKLSSTSDTREIWKGDGDHVQPLSLTSSLSKAMKSLINPHSHLISCWWDVGLEEMLVYSVAWPDLWWPKCSGILPKRSLQEAPEKYQPEPVWVDGCRSDPP